MNKKCETCKYARFIYIDKRIRCYCPNSDTYYTDHDLDDTCKNHEFIENDPRVNLK